MGRRCRGCAKKMTRSEVYSSYMERAGREVGKSCFRDQRVRRMFNAKEAVLGGFCRAWDSANGIARTVGEGHDWEYCQRRGLEARGLTCVACRMICLL